MKIRQREYTCREQDNYIMRRKAFQEALLNVLAEIPFLCYFISWTQETEHLPSGRKRKGLPMIISERIFQILEKKNISQKHFSQETGISQSTISDWKRKKTNPSADKIMIICDALQVTPYQLLCGVEEGDTPDCFVLSKGTEEYMLIEKYRAIDRQRRSRVFGYLQALAEEGRE